MSDWPTVRLGDVTGLVAGYPFPSAEFTDHPTDPRLLRGDNVGQGALRWEGAKRWPARKTDGLDDYWLQRDDVILAMDRPWIEAGLKFAAVRDADLPSLLVQRVSRIRGSSRLDSRFLKHVIASRSFTDYILSVQTGTTVPHISATQILDFKFRLPPIEEQGRIAAILGAFDDKIELNRRTSETLEAAARAIFRSWSIDDAPAGGSVRGLDEVAKFLNGLALQRFPPTADRSLPVIKIAQLRSGDTRDADRASADLPADYVVRDGDVLFSWSGSLECVLWAGGKGALNQHLFKVTSADFPKWFYYLWIHQHLADFREIAAGKATTMGHIQRHHLADAKVSIPPPAVLASADRVLGPMIEQICLRGVEARTLADIRDALLPRLLSGQLTP